MMLTGCGGGEPDPERETALGDVGAAAYEAACDAFESRLYDTYGSSRLVTVACTALALDEADTAGACADDVQDCLANPPQAAVDLVEDVLSQANCQQLDVEPEGCARKTLADLRSCLDALEAEVENLELTLTCAAVGEPLEPDWAVLTLPEECATLDEAC